MNSLRSAFNGLMKKHHRQAVLLGHTMAMTPEDYFGFHHSHVETVHFHKTEVGAGVWFRLRCGRVVDDVARPACRDPGVYDYSGDWG